MKNSSLKKYILRTFFALIILANLTHIISKLTTSSLIGEIIVSFEPYTFALAIITSVFLVSWIIWISLKQFRKKEGLKRFFRVRLLLFITTGILLSNSVWMGVEVLGFYYPLNKIEAASARNFKVGFYNKYFPNENFDQINLELNELDLDVLGMGELTRKQMPQIAELSQYKYSYTEDCVCDYPQDVALFSKFPIIAAKTYGVIGARVIEADINIEEKIVKVFVVHTTAPMSKVDFKRRNQELQELAKILNSNTTDQEIIMGDFNISPWSISYKRFTSDLDNLKNTAQNAGLRFTWGTSLLRTHIDHIFVNKNWKIVESEVGGQWGSDHSLVWSKIAY